MRPHVTRVALLALFLSCLGSSALLAQARCPAQVVFGENMRLSDVEAEGHDESEPAIAVNPADPLNVVMVFHNTGPGSSPCRNAYSLDGGEPWSLGGDMPQQKQTNTCSDPSVVADLGGRSYASYAEYNFFQGPLSILFVKSTNGGQSWSAPAAVATGLPSQGQFPLRGSNPLFSTPGDFSGFRSNSFPTAAAASDGTLYVSWVDFPVSQCFMTGLFRPQCSNADVRMSVSRDGGRRWSAPVKVTDETNPTDQFMPWIAAHPDGLVSVIWSDRRLGASNILIDAFYTDSGDGKLFLPNRRISSQSSSPPGSFFFGDYNNLAVSAERIFPVWNDIRAGEDTDIFTARGLRLRSR